MSKEIKSNESRIESLEARVEKLERAAGVGPTRPGKPIVGKSVPSKPAPKPGK